MLRKVENNEVCREELISQLGYVVNVLDSAFSDESKSVNTSYNVAAVISAAQSAFAAYHPVPAPQIRSTILALYKLVCIYVYV